MADNTEIYPRSRLQAAAQASYYLPSYDARQVASTINTLREQIEAVKKTNLSKKKFGFSRKLKKGMASTQPVLTKVQNKDTQQAKSQPQVASDVTHSSSDFGEAQDHR